MKRMITISVIVLSSLFGWVGQIIDKGNWFGGWSIILGSIGAFAGVWVGYKVYKVYF